MQNPLISVSNATGIRLTMLCNIRRMPAHLSPTLIFLICLSGAVVSVRGNSAVMEIKTSYSCCNRTITFEPNCANFWNINNKLFAYTNGASNGSSNRCISPCLKIEDGRMTLDRCAEVNAIVVCSDETNMAAEKRVCYYGQPCSGSVSKAGNQGLVGVLLLAVIITGSIVTG